MYVPVISELQKSFLYFTVKVSTYLHVICCHFICLMLLFQGHVPCRNFTPTRPESQWCSLTYSFYYCFIVVLLACSYQSAWTGHSEPRNHSALDIYGRASGSKDEIKDYGKPPDLHLKHDWYWHAPLQVRNTKRKAKTIPIGAVPVYTKIFSLCRGVNHPPLTTPPPPFTPPLTSLPLPSPHRLIWNPCTIIGSLLSG